MSDWQEVAADTVAALIEDRGEEVFLDRLAGGARVVLSGIFENAYATALTDPGVATTIPVFTLLASDLPSNVTAGDPGDRLTIRGQTYEVRRHEPDGVAAARLVLELID